MEGAQQEVTMENDFEFHWRYADYEVRTTHGLKDDTPYVELVHWEQGDDGRRYCYTIAYWSKGSEGWDLRFVGDRLLELSQLHIEKVWPQICAAQIALEGWFADQERMRF